MRNFQRGNKGNGSDGLVEDAIVSNAYDYRYKNNPVEQGSPKV